MQEKPRVVVARTRRPGQDRADFAVTSDQIPASDGFVREYRQHAWAAFKRQSIPDATMEAWRRTDLRTMPVADFQFSDTSARRAAVPAPLLQPLAADQHGGQVVLSGTKAELSLDPELAAKGIVFTDLKTAQASHPEILRRVLGQVVNAEEGKFAAMAAALAQSGVLLYVPRGVVVEAPLHSILWGPGPSASHISHLLVYLDEGSSATYVHESASPTETEDSLYAGLVEIKVSAGAALTFVELQSWGKHVWNFTHERIRLDREARLEWIFGAIGSKLTKNFSELDLAEEGARGRMSGFYFTDGVQHLDHDTQQNHLAPNTASDLLFKGALKGHSRSVWQGMIYVARGAAKTDGYQANRNLVLDDTARADSIPGLEILADDVRCTHGATVGKLEQEPLFYLNSRGISPTDATSLLVEGFFDPIMQRIPFEGVRDRFHHAILDKMSNTSTQAA